MILGGILLACGGWAFTFGFSRGNFWGKIGLSVLTVCLYSIIWQKPKISFRLKPLVGGVLSAAVLYGIFYAGNALSPYLIFEAHNKVENIYVLGQGTSKLLVFLLLFFVTGPGEEIFWRGFVQDNLMKKWGSFAGFTITTLIYGGVHIFSLNLMLILAAFVAGAFWGILYLLKRDLFLLVTSHSFWSSTIFAIAPTG